jgi:endonuclease YncB( thermonuclease family)
MRFFPVSCVSQYAKEITRTIDGMVTKISDGETIHVTNNHGTKVKVRFYGIDAPETEKSCKKIMSDGKHERSVAM